jgi:hypothetical protein
MPARSPRCASMTQGRTRGKAVHIAFRRACPIWFATTEWEAQTRLEVPE